MNKILRVSSIILGFFFVLILISIGLRAAVISGAEERTRKFVEILRSKNSEDEKLVNLTLEIAKSFRVEPPKSLFPLRIRSVANSRYLPDFIRIPRGVLESYVFAGLCDNAVHLTQFILDQENYQSVQFNMVADDDAHSALLVTTQDGHRVLIDPFYGIVAGNRAHLIGPDDIHAGLKAGKAPSDLFQFPDKGKGFDFYQNFQNLHMAAQGDPLLITYNITFNDMSLLTLGTLDSDAHDVQSAGRELKIGPFFHYMGHRYERDWERHLTANRPVKIEMILSEPPRDGVIITEPKPEIEGKKLTWHRIDPVTGLSFYDGRAIPSLRSLKSYIDIDQITITPLEK